LNRGAHISSKVSLYLGLVGQGHITDYLNAKSGLKKYKYLNVFRSEAKKVDSKLKYDQLENNDLNYLDLNL